MEEVGIRVCRILSSPIIMAIKRAWRWHRLRCYMVVDVKLCYFRVRLENGRFLDLTYCMKPRSKFVWLGRTCMSCNLGRRATPIIGEESWALKLEILYTSMCRHCEVYTVSRYEASSHQGSMDHSRFWRREVKYLPIGVAVAVIWCAWHVPCLSMEEMSACAWRAIAHGRLGY
jgi:hypothetical protein